MVTYVQAIRGQVSTIKQHLPFVCPEVSFVERMLNSSEALVILAKDEAVIVGAVGGWLEGTPSGYDIEDEALRQHGAYHEAHLCWIAVKEQYRERGIGSALVEKVCNWAREKGKKKIWTEVSRKTSDFDTVTFYENIGFTEIEAFQDEKGEEYVTMLKQL